MADSDEERVLANFVGRDQRLRAIPAQRKKRMVVLRWLAEQFRPGVRYPEADVNRILGRRHQDVESLRRLLVDEELMQRHSGVYWRTGSVPYVGIDPPWPMLAGRGVEVEVVLGDDGPAADVLEAGQHR